MNESERCQHPDCVYRASTLEAYNCNYAAMTGKCRTARLPERLTKPSLCPYYLASGKAPKAEKTEDWRDAARRLYDAGATDHEIAEALGLRYNRVGEWRRGQGLPLHPERKGPLAQFDWKTAAELYKRGASDCDIAKAIGCSVSSVWRWRYKYELFQNRGRGQHKKKVKT